MVHAQTWPNKSPPDVVGVMTKSLMTQQPASPSDVYSIAVITKSSSKVQYGPKKSEQPKSHLSVMRELCYAFWS
jgi:hypothetical protein